MPYSASALERFVYCPMSWWLARQGVGAEGAAARRGHERHARKGTLLRAWQALVAAYERHFDAAVLFTLVACAAVLLAIDVALFDPSSAAGLFLLLLTLLSLLAAIGYLLRALRARERGEEARLAAGVLQGELAYSDLDRPAEVLRSERYDLWGRPDYVVRREGRLVPVEVKTGRAPREPHPSHVVQAAAYALLVHEATGERPPYAVLSYENGRDFEVPYDEAAERKVLVTLLRMRLAEATGEVRRGHRSVARCGGCSRRDACPERLV